MNAALFMFAMSLQLTAPPPQDPAPPPVKPEKKICRAIVPTGSIFDKKVCLTRSEWKAFQQHNDATTEYATQKRGTGMCDPAPGGCVR